MQLRMRAQVLAKIVEAKQSRSEQAQLFVRMHIAQYQLALGEQAATKALIEAATEELTSLHDVRPPDSKPFCCKIRSRPANRECLRLLTPPQQKRQMRHCNSVVKCSTLSRETQ